MVPVPDPVPPSPFAQADLDGRLLAGRYRVGSAIASGGMAQVRRGTDEVLGRQVAIKILHPHLAGDEVVVDRFRREAVAAARLTDPAIVAIYDTVVDGGLNAIVMELVDGITLRDYLDQEGALDPREAVDIVSGVAQALAVAHEAGIVHRDVKPANILLCDDRRVKVADFGIAKAGIGADLTHTGTMIGTAKYLAPEQVEGGRVDPRTDLYSLGVVLYESLTGRPPFEGDTDASVALARLHRDPLRPRQVRPSVPRSLDVLCMEALARHPDDRPTTADEFRARLHTATATDATAHDADHTIVAPLAAAAAEPTSFARSERRWLVPAFLVIVLGGGLILAGVLIGRTETGQQFFDRAREVVLAGNPRVEDLALAAVATFDPLGDNWEYDEIAPLAIDGNPDTAWHTEFYDVPTWDNKAGVGLVVTLEGGTTVREVEITSPTQGWGLDVHVGDGPPTELSGWGLPAGAAENLDPGTHIIRLDATPGNAVLLWITDLGDHADPAAQRVHLADVTVRGS